ncbi:MAG: copper resistance protein CopC [bacterium]|uniref:Copper resistance protein CopC n=1 Tax=Candidatus Methylomirabilis tolerans TaxID=3123416 RepID=A0AAJ1AJ21_9BACT|nr:copper resistance protein CopC [Candidatus Methylomirabilis sp.]
MAYWDRKHYHDNRSLARWSSFPALVMGLLLTTSLAWGHAFPDHSDPRVGWTVDKSPAQVRIWFDGAIEPAFSTIKVVNADGQQVNKQDGRVNAADPTLLEVDLPPLSPGKYRVFWSVVAIDTHRTEGDYPFTVAGAR